jgi:hypothetical protein
VRYAQNKHCLSIYIAKRKEFAGKKLVMIRLIFSLIAFLLASCTNLKYPDNFEFKWASFGEKRILYSCDSSNKLQSLLFHDEGDISMIYELHGQFKGIKSNYIKGEIEPQIVYRTTHFELIPLGPLNLETLKREANPKMVNWIWTICE